VKAVIVADGDVSPDALANLSAFVGDGERPLVVAADGGALKAELLGLVPDVVVGDLDSVSTEAVSSLRQAGTQVLRHDRNKDESDTQLALREAISRGARSLLIVGGLGGRRIDHGLANVLLLTLPELAGCDAVLLAGDAAVRVIGTRGPDQLELRGRPGDLVSLLPLSDSVEGVTTAGLAYALEDEPLIQGPSRGLSNVMQGEFATISTHSGRLAVIHGPAQQHGPAQEGGTHDG
jgi:thiamine pyrophosphokinase